MKIRTHRRQIFVFTAEEKMVAACIVGAILLGLAVQHYRAVHSSKRDHAQAAKTEAQLTQPED